MTDFNARLFEFIKQLPKAEIHSHLAGSIRDSTLIELMPLDQTHLASVLENSKTRTLSECFQVFDVIHKTVNTSTTVTRLVREMVEDNVADNVVYLEMRSTPRALADFCHAEGAITTTVPGDDWNADLSCLDDPLEAHITGRPARVDAALSHYVETVVAAIEACPAVRSGAIHVRLILSVNRTSSLASMERIVRLASAWRRACPLIVGMDISGDPTRGQMAPILDLLQREARPSDMPISIHAGEVMNVAETEAILAFRPERLGHCCVLSEPHRVRMLSLKIPLELCPTSNCLTLHLPTFSFHPQADYWLDNAYPVAICTDDSGVFNVTLSQEIHLVAVTRSLSMSQVADLVVAAFDFLFCDVSLRKSLRARARAEADRLMLSFGSSA